MKLMFDIFIRWLLSEIMAPCEDQSPTPESIFSDGADIVEKTSRLFWKHRKPKFPIYSFVFSTWLWFDTCERCISGVLTRVKNVCSLFQQSWRVFGSVNRSDGRSAAILWSPLLRPVEDRGRWSCGAARWLQTSNRPTSSTGINGCLKLASFFYYTVRKKKQFSEIKMWSSSHKVNRSFSTSPEVTDASMLLLSTHNSTWASPLSDPYRLMMALCVYLTATLSAPVR